MQKITEITIFTKGNAKNAKTWSNIPYYFTSTLESKGYKINLVNVDSHSIWEKIYDKAYCRLLRKIFIRKTTFTYERSLRYSKEVYSLMENAVCKFPSSDIFVSTSFSYAPIGLTDKPCVLFCDWTYDYYLNYFRKRKPDFLEKKEVIRQNKIIENADAVFSLFPDVTDYMRQKYCNPHIYYLGNVINSETIEYDISILRARTTSPHVLFIGLPKYLEGALSLINALSTLQKKGLSLELDIIGMTPQDIPQKLPPFVHCHGYLEKSIPAEKTLYDSLLKQAWIYVNTTPIWAGFSSALESMYHYIPIITTPYKSFIDTFGETIDFGYYCNKNEANTIASSLETLASLKEDEYLTLCQNARNAANPFTWSTYVDKMINTITDISF